MEKKINLKVKKHDVFNCLSCPLCKNLFDRATSISECLHTFCKKCIEDKLTKENLRACPVCNVDLGVRPLERLRLDCIYEDVRQKVYKPKQETVKAPPSLQYSRKKKKPQSSSTTVPEQVPDTPLEQEVEAVSSKPISTLRRRPRKNSKPKRSSTIVEPEEKETGNVSNNIQQDNASQEARAYKSKGKAKMYEEDNEILSDDIGKEVNQNTGEDNQEVVVARRSLEKSSGKKPMVSKYSPPVLRPRRRRTMNSSSKRALSMEIEKNKVEASKNPVWFKLVAAKNTGIPLPQISPDLYLRVTGNAQVSYVKKYVVHKLDLDTEEEVDIWLRQEPVCPTQRLHSLVDWWVETTPISERTSPIIGASGGEFVMVLHYSRSHRFSF